MGGGVLRTAASAGRLTTPIVDKMAAFTGFRRAASAAAAPASVGVTGVPSLTTLSSGREQVVETLPKQQGIAKGEEWEFTGGVEEDLFDQTCKSSPRLVFGPVATYEEAKEATADLKHAIDEVYFSSPIAASDDATYGFNDSSCATSSNNLLSPMHFTNECSASQPSASKHILQTFSMLKECPEVQSVVASLASDKNVWDAVMKNDKVLEYCHKTDGLPWETTEDGHPQNEQPKGASKEQHGKKENIFLSFITNAKKNIQNMISSISGLMDNFLTSVGLVDISTEGGTDPKNNNGKMIGASFMALAVAVIMVILFKRH